MIANSSGVRKQGLCWCLDVEENSLYSSDLRNKEKYSPLGIAREITTGSLKQMERQVNKSTADQRVSKQIK